MWEQLSEAPAATAVPNNQHKGGRGPSKKKHSPVPNGSGTSGIPPPAPSSSSSSTPSFIADVSSNTTTTTNSDEATRQSLIALASAKEERKRKRKAEKEARRAEKRRRKAERRRRREMEAARRDESEEDEDEEEEEDSPNECEIIEKDGQCIVNIKPKKPIKLKIKSAEAVSNGVDSNGHDVAAGNDNDDDEEEEEEEEDRSSSKTNDSSGKSATASSAGQQQRRKSGSDVRTWCDACSSEGANANLVRCDECRRCFHFWCLQPPVKKSPKVAGYGWQCTDCSPSEVDSDWHLD